MVKLSSKMIETSSASLYYFNKGYRGLAPINIERGKLMYDGLIWELATMNAEALVVFALLILILDFLRTLLFKSV